MIVQDFRWRCALGTHPFSSRTRWLRPWRPMILHWRRCGKAGGCRNPFKNYIRKGVQIRWIYQWFKGKKHLGLEWLINDQSEEKQASAEAEEARSGSLKGNTEYFRLYLENRILKLISSIKYLMSKKDEIGKYLKRHPRSLSKDNENKTSFL